MTEDMEAKNKDGEKSQGVPGESEKAGDGQVVGEGIPQDGSTIQDEKEEKVEVEPTLPNGDRLVHFNEDSYLEGISNQGLSPAQIRTRHTVKILDRSHNASHRFPFLVDCSCGFQGRQFTEADAIAVAKHHLQIRGYRNG